MIDALVEMFSYRFIVRAGVVGLLVSLCAALLGVCLVLKRYSMIGDGLSHVGFGALAVASALGLAPMAVAVPVVVVAAFLLLRLSSRGKLKGGTFKVRPGIAIVRVDIIGFYIRLQPDKIGKQFSLVAYAVAFLLIAVLSGKPNVQGGIPKGNRCFFRASLVFALSGQNAFLPFFREAGCIRRGLYIPSISHCLFRRNGK